MIGCDVTDTLSEGVTVVAHEHRFIIPHVTIVAATRIFRMLDRVHEAVGITFRPVSAYRDDLSPLWARIDRFDKFERLQHFRQPEDASWRAFAAGRWEESLELKECERPVVEAEFAEDARLGYNSHRVRVVEFPITPYLHWEMLAFTIRVECGENIRIVGPEALGRYETDDVAPELIFMGNLAMYEVLYDETGVLAGGQKFTDPELIAGCLSEVQTLYAQGEDFRTFFQREIAPLPPPVVDPEISPSTGW